MSETLNDLLLKLQDRHRRGLIPPYAWQLVRFASRIGGSENPHLLLAACLAGCGAVESQVCVDLAATARCEVFADLDEEGRAIPDSGIRAPDLCAWRKALLDSPLCGRPGQDAPFVLDEGNHLYLHRYWELEQRLAEGIASRLHEPPHLELPGLRRSLANLSGWGDEKDERLIERFSTALERCVTVVTGGPGTGKTTIAARLLAGMLNRESERLAAGVVSPRLRIGLAAPTGKAAARMQEAMRAALEELEPTSLGEAPSLMDAVTLHRLIGLGGRTAKPRYDAGNQLLLDVLVIDEASMVSLELLARTLEALPESARLVLLGDPHQLASVEAGSVLADLCASVPSADLSPPAKPLLGAALVRLTRNWRFGAESGIGRLASLVRDGRVREILELLRDTEREDLAWSTACGDVPLSAVIEDSLQGCAGFAGAGAPREALAALDRFRILCALRHGPPGSESLNRRLARAFGSLHPGAGPPTVYHRLPIMVRANDYELGLFNGDVGLLWDAADPGLATALERSETESKDGTGSAAFTPQAGTGNWLALFETREGDLRAVDPARLPRCETAFALTVHQSQGSEFDEVLLVLPDRDSPVLCRELLYTAVTRARKKLSVFGSEEILRAAIERPYRRSSGLGDALRRRIDSPHA